jgi:hypothetical protein
VRRDGYRAAGVLVSDHVRGCVRSILGRTGGVVVTGWRLCAWLMTLAVLSILYGYLGYRAWEIIN